MAPDFVGRERAIFSGNNCCKVRTKREETVERQDFARVKLECHHIRTSAMGSLSLSITVHFRQVFTVAYLSAALDKSDRLIQDELLTVNRRRRRPCVCVEKPAAQEISLPNWSSLANEHNALRSEVQQLG